MNMALPNRQTVITETQDCEPIRGIYNYCDRWCERCPFTTRCTAFRLEQQELGDDEEDYDDLIEDAGEDQGIWRRLQSSFEQTLALVEEIARQDGIEIHVAPQPELPLGWEGIEQVVAEPLIGAASHYAELVDLWLEDEPATAMLASDPSDSGGTSADDPDGTPQTVGDAIAVLRWYQFQIATKLVRAVSDRIEEDSTADASELTEIDGSVKVALIGMDRSLTAWRFLRAHLAGPAVSRIERIASHLELLRSATEHEFPHARDFVRPGFDTVPRQRLH